MSRSSLCCKTNDELFALYYSEWDEEKKSELRQEITLRYVYIVKAVAWQMRDLYSGFAQPEDIVDEGVLKIMKGIDRYDPDRDCRFEAFVSRRIRGMVIDLVRKNDWMPRNYHRDRKSIEKAVETLTRKKGSAPSDDELVKYLSIDEKKLHKIRRMSRMGNVLSLDMTYNDNDETILQVPSDKVSEQPEQSLLKNEQKKVLAEAIEKLQDKEKTVISLYYVEELNMNEIADVMGVSQPRVSQLHAQAIKKLRKYLNEDEEISA
ncbi:MAG: FliA/WhiG family RNA polymerase sigma factor [Eubacteriales bacterium]|jgi:RNA polymerase sigma factor for flagellar operon FliA